MNNFKPKLKFLSDHGVSNNRYYNWKKKNKIPITLPYCMYFVKKCKKLYFLAVNHTNNKKSKTFKMIKECLCKNNIDLVIIENLYYQEGLNPKINFIGEGAYSAKLADKNCIQYCGVEGDLIDINKSVIKNHNVINKDIILHICLANYKYFHRNFSENIFFKKTDDLVDAIKHDFSVKNFNFKKYFQKRIGEEFKFGETDLEIASPDKNGKYITNYIGYLYQFERDKIILKNLYELINKYNKIAIIYGNNHYYAQKGVLQYTFGKSKKIY